VFQKKSHWNEKQEQHKVEKICRKDGTVRRKRGFKLSNGKVVNSTFNSLKATNSWKRLSTWGGGGPQKRGKSKWLTNAGVVERKKTEKLFGGGGNGKENCARRRKENQISGSAKEKKLLKYRGRGKYERPCT